MAQSPPPETIRVSLRSASPFSHIDHAQRAASHLVLGGLAVNLGFEGLLAADVYLDLLGLGFGFLGEVDL